MRIVKQYCWETAFDRNIRQLRKYEVVFCSMNTTELDLPLPRKEIIRIAWKAVPDCIQMLCTHTYICTACLVVYGTLWSMDRPLDTALFALLTCLLNYLEQSVIDFGIGIRNLVHYFAALKRIQVNWLVGFVFILFSSLRSRHFYYSMNPNATNDYSTLNRK
jgi:hypothetical protein